MVTATAATMLAAPAIAQAPSGSQYAWAETDDDTALVGAEDEDTDDATEPSERNTSGPSPCTWTAVEADVVSEQATLVLERSPNANYAWFLKECTNPDESVTRQLIPVEVGEPTPPPDPEALRARAIDELVLPEPSISMNPPGDQLVHVPSWLWIDDTAWQPHSRSASAGRVTATVTATPTRALWDMGTSEVVACDGPGVPYDTGLAEEAQSTSCSHTYRRSSAGLPGDAYPVTVTIEWDVSWSVTGAPGGGPLASLTTSTSTSVPVAEAQALNQ